VIDKIISIIFNATEIVIGIESQFFIHMDEMDDKNKN